MSAAPTDDNVARRRADIEGMTRNELLQLPPAVDVRTAARVLGVGRTAAYGLVRAGAWPTPVLRLGTAIRIPTAPLLRLLGVAPEVAAELPVTAHG